MDRSGPVRAAERIGAGGERRLRLLLVVDSLQCGGAERHVVDLALELHRRGHEVTVACSTAGVLARSLAEGGVQARPLVGRLVKRRLSVVFAAKLRTLLKLGAFDLVHAHVYASAAASALATSATSIPLVITEHTEGPWRTGRARVVSRWTYDRAAHLIVVSRAIRRLLVEGYSVPPSRISFILPAVTRHPPRRAPWPPLPRRWTEGQLVGRVGRLQPEKGMELFLRATAHVAPLFPNAHFLVIGDGPLRRPLELLSQRLGLGDCVHFLGFRPDARDLMALLDVLVVSSLTDGSPLVVPEAMAAGVAVVAGAVGGIPDQIHHERDGLLVPPGDSDALANTLAGLLQDPRRARRIGEAGRGTAASSSHQGMVDEIEAVYVDAVGRRRAALRGR